MEGLKIERVSMTDEACQRILETAVDAGVTFGIGYWCEVLRVITHGDRCIALEIIEHESHPRKRRKIIVGYAAIRRGVAKMFREPSEYYDVGRLLTDDLDGPLCDVIIQMATFGSVEYA